LNSRNHRHFTLPFILTFILRIKNHQSPVVVDHIAAAGAVHTAVAAQTAAGAVRTEVVDQTAAGAVQTEVVDQTAAEADQTAAAEAGQIELAVQTAAPGAGHIGVVVAAAWLACHNFPNFQTAQ
jgi:hypothetical protein